MNKLRIAIIKRVLMLDTEEELRKIEVNVLDAISNELSKDDKEQDEFVRELAISELERLNDNLKEFLGKYNNDDEEVEKTVKQLLQEDK